MSKADIIFSIAAVATFVGVLTASMAASGQFEPAIVAVMAGVSAGCTALVAFISKPAS